MDNTRKSSYKGYSEARKACNAKYKEEKLETIYVYVPKGQKEKIKEFARGQGMSMNQFINLTIQKALDNVVADKDS